MRRFSKEQAPEERQRTAEAIKASRSEHFARRAEVEAQMPEREKELAKKLLGLTELSNKLDQLNSSRLSELANYFKIRKMKADLVKGQTSYDELERQHAIQSAEHKQLVDNSHMAPKMQEAAGLLDKFYAEQEAKWTNAEYSKEDIAENFSEEHLASLSTDDYIKLLKRFPNNMVAHVTRQGIRDHVGMVFHTAGEGAYTDAFMKMTADGRLRSPLGVYMLEKEKDEAVAEYLHLENAESKEQAQQRLDNLLSGSDQGSYADSAAIHFATEMAANHLYGSEEGNEVTIIYPSAYIASQYHFNGSLASGDSSYWNDQWVWANEEKGMDLAAGLIFIPAETPVNPKTGSRYELDEKMEPAIDTDSLEKLKQVFVSDDFLTFAKEAKTALKTGNDYELKWNDPKLEWGYKAYWEAVKPLQDKLITEFGITDKRLQFSLLDSATLTSLAIDKDNQSNPTHVITEAMKKNGVLFKEAKETVKSKDFWENYLKEHPSKTPLKIVFYQGTDPTEAIHNWRRENGLEKRSNDENIGFPERRVQRDSPEANVGAERFRSIAQKIIDERWPEAQAKTLEEHVYDTDGELIPPDDDDLPPPLLK